MNTKLTLRLDDRLIDRAKRYSHRSGSRSPSSSLTTSLSSGRRAILGTELTPRVRAMIGALKGAAASDEYYLHHLEEQYR